MLRRFYRWRVCRLLDQDVPESPSAGMAEHGADLVRVDQLLRSGMAGARPAPPEDLAPRIRAALDRAPRATDGPRAVGWFVPAFAAAGVAAVLTLALALRTEGPSAPRNLATSPLSRLASILRPVPMEDMLASSCVALRSSVDDALRTEVEAVGSDATRAAGALLDGVSGPLRGLLAVDVD